MRGHTRRTFLTTAPAAIAGAVAFPSIVKASALGLNGAVPPSDRVVMAGIGFGMQGPGNMRNFLGKPEVQWVAVCDLDDEILKKAKDIVDEKYGNADCKAYKDYREMYARGDLDAVSIAVPDHWHAILSALPVIGAEIGWISMSLVDTLMVGPLGAAAIGAVGTGSILYMAVMMVGFGTLLALDTFVSQSYGAGRIDLCHRWLFAGVQLAVVLAVVLTACSMLLIWLLPAFGLHPDVLALIRPYLRHLQWSTAPLLAYAVFRRYLQAMHVVRPVMYGAWSSRIWSTSSRTGC